MITDPVSMTKMIPISGSTRIWPVMRPSTASVAPRARAPESPMKIWAGWTLNHRKPEQRADDDRAEDAQVHLVRDVQQGDQHVGDERDRDGAAGQAVQPVRDVHAVGRGDDREGREEDVDGRVDVDGADERDRDRG